ncbi:MAG: ribonuclease HII [bacterium]|nr:ribonuclease HII [bacterium]
MLNRSKKIVFGVDEVGRGPLAGPVFAVAIIAPAKLKMKNEKLKIKDSKKLTAKQRENIYAFLKESPEVFWAIGKVSEKIIDKINILQATKLAMEKAVINLEKKINKQASMLLIDGNFGINLNRPQQSIIKGDEKIFLISLASIVAKVTRDNLMIKLHKKYPEYGLDKHKGYGTPQHLSALSKFGPCPLHRKSFKPKLLQ